MIYAILPFLVIALAALFLTWFYLLPSQIAIARNNPRICALMVFNILLGWTGIGWLIAAAWALIAAKPSITPQP